MKSAKYTIEETVQPIQEVDLEEHTSSVNRYIKKRMQSKEISKIRNMERLDILLAVYSLLQDSQPTTASVERSFGAAIA